MSRGSSTGISTISLLGVVFIVLKLCKVIDWSWCWVLVPFWGGIALFVAIVVIYFLVKLSFKRKKTDEEIWKETLESFESKGSLVSKPKSRFQQQLEEFEKFNRK